MGTVRNLNVHEYVSMDLFSQYGVATPECHVASTAEEAENIFMNSLNKRMFNNVTFIGGIPMCFRVTRKSYPLSFFFFFSVVLRKAGEKLRDVVMKAQVISGGRSRGRFKTSGLRGGVHFITKPGQAREFASKMLADELVTKQSKDGIICNKVLLMERIYFRRVSSFIIILSVCKCKGMMLVLVF